MDARTCQQVIEDTIYAMHAEGPLPNTARTWAIITNRVQAALNEWALSNIVIDCTLHLDPPACECGVKFTGGIHSDWCPAHV